MKERLDKFIKTEGLTPSRFAEIMGVQPSSISHILGGRNKPSYDFIEKILLRFPKLNPDWLILGKGDIYRTTPGHFQISDSRRVEPVQENLFASRRMPQQTTGRTDVNPPDKEVIVETIPEEKKGNDLSAEIRRHSQSKSHIPADQPINSDIEKIVVFFKNKSFISYNPQ